MNISSNLCKGTVLEPELKTVDIKSSSFRFYLQWRSEDKRKEVDQGRNKDKKECSSEEEMEQFLYWQIQQFKEQICDNVNSNESIVRHPIHFTDKVHPETGLEKEAICFLCLIFASTFRVPGMQLLEAVQSFITENAVAAVKAKR